jgi:hypothetical protein
MEIPNAARSILKKKEKKEKKKKIPIKMFAGNKSIPEKIVIYYCKQIDFSKIDTAIRYKYKMLKENLEKLRKKKDGYENEAFREEDVSKVKYYHSEIEKLEEMIEDYTHDKSLGEYISEADVYLKLLKEKPNDQVLIDHYLAHCRKHISIDLIKNLEEALRCKGCNQKLDEELVRDAPIVCPRCDCLNTSMRPSKYIKDVEYGNAVYDEDIVNFMKVLDKFEGKNNTPIHSSLYDELDRYMKNINQKPGEYYRKMKKDENGKKKGTSKRLLWQALESLGYNQYYDEAGHICHVYWGWDLHDLSLYRDRLIEDYQNTQMVWKQIRKNYDRSASLGTQYRLYVQLLSIDYPRCDREDFRIQESVESLRLHNHAWKRMCEKTGVKYCPVSS